MLFFIIQFSCDFISIFWFFIFFIIYLFKLRLTPCLIWVKRLKTTFSLLKHWSVAPRILFLHAICWVFCRLQSTNQLAFYVCTPLNYTCSSWGEISQCSIYSMFSFILFYFIFFITNEYLALQDLTMEHFEQDGLLAHSWLVPLLVHLLVVHWLISLAEQGLFN